MEGVTLYSKLSPLLSSGSMHPGPDSFGGIRRICVASEKVGDFEQTVAADEFGGEAFTTATLSFLLPDRLRLIHCCLA